MCRTGVIMNNTKFKTLNRVAKNKKVKLIYQDDDGIWCELVNGWGMEECVSFRSENCADLIEQFKRVTEYHQDT